MDFRFVDISKINNSSIRLPQIYAILSYLDQHDGVNKEVLYSNLNGSRQTKIKILQDMINLGWVEKLSTVGPHNTQTIVITDSGRLQLSVMEGKYSAQNSIDTSFENRHVEIGCKCDIDKIKTKIQLSIDYLNEKNPEIDFIKKVLNDALDELKQNE